MGSGSGGAEAVGRDWGVDTTIVVMMTGGVIDTRVRGFHVDAHSG